jgi:SAM-dependent methyltransferase
MVGRLKMQIQRRPLSREEVLDGYDAVSSLYPHIPPMLLWRSWEYAAYRRYTLAEPVLDVGCGDGRYFRLVWPQMRHVVGVDMDAGVANAARRSGVYEEVHVAPAHQLPTPAEYFGSAFANCALEHMDHLDAVLGAIYHSLRPGGTFVLSVVTDKFLEWTSLPLLFGRLGLPEQATAFQRSHADYHHLVNPLAPEDWAEHLAGAGFEVIEHAPIVPEQTSRLFLFLDQLWHVRRAQGELGNAMQAYAKQIPRFPQALRQVFGGFLEMERDWTIGSGAVFYARRNA